MERNVFDKAQYEKIGRSVFDLSYEVKTSGDLGQLIPVMADEVYPGDSFKINCELIIRFNQLLAPIMHEIYAHVLYAFIPYRILDPNWEDFITGGPDNDNAYVLPRWNPTDTAAGSLWDLMGFPVGINPDGARPLDYIKRAYNAVYNEYYRDENLIDEIDINTSESVRIRAWAKDYFVSALPWQQRGIAGALPLSGTTNAVFFNDGASNNAFLGTDPSGTEYPVTVGETYDHMYIPGHTQAAYRAANALTNGNSIDFADAGTFDINDIRDAFALQTWMEISAKSGARYTEVLKAFFDVSPNDDRLGRPEIIGAMKAPVIVSEVRQTSSTDATSPQGHLTGNATVAEQKSVGSYFVKEHGIIMGILSVMPVPEYQQGIDRQWLRENKYDFYWPQFANLGEQAIKRAEVYTSAVAAENNTIFGYAERYAELRSKRSSVRGLMRSDFDHWHLSRQFGSAPLLNQSFIECVPRKDIFALPTQPAMIITVGNNIIASRPIPAFAIPSKLV